MARPLIVQWQRSAAWADHVAAGGTTAYADFVGEADTDRPLHGANNAEFARRLTLAGASPELRTRALAAPAAGRGRPSFYLPGTPTTSGFGTVDPDEIAADELLRIAVTVIAEDLVVEWHQREAVVAPSEKVRYRGRRYLFAGHPMQGIWFRQQLLAEGRPQGGARPLVIILGSSLERMLADAWVGRTLRGKPSSWPEFVAWTHEHGLPDRVDLPALVRRYAANHPRRRIKIVCDQNELTGLLKTRSPITPAASLGYDAAELARRVGQVLAGLVDPPTRVAILEQIVAPRLWELPHGPTPGVPPQERAWLERRAAKLRAAIEAAGVEVIGDSAIVTAPAGEVTGRPTAVTADAEAMVQLALTYLVRQDQAAPPPTPDLEQP